MLSDILLFTAIGLAAQLVDGAIGMAYGITATTVLVSVGTSPAIASASVHTAEMFTSATSGFAHYRIGNVIWGLVWRLALPGMLGGIVGAYALTELPAHIIRPAVALYLLVMGLMILLRIFQQAHGTPLTTTGVALVGAAGGFLDAIGGGGWGAIVTSTLIARGTLPRNAIGSASLAEFFVTVSITITFLFTIGLSLWPIITGLVIGGAIAAPFAAYMARHVPERPMMFLVAAVVILLSLRNLIIAFG